MKMKSLSVIFVMTAAFVLLSCPSPGGGSSGGGPTYQSKTFWAQNMSTNKYYQLTADLVAQGRYCKVYVERGSGVSESTAQAMTNTYDTKIYDEMIKNFGKENFSWEGDFYRNTMDAADIDGDGKLTILLLDIKDDYSSPIDSYVAGYFWGGNFMSRTNTSNTNYKYSNEIDMIYIDTYPGMLSTNKIDPNLTVAHEMQHLMNFISSIIENRSNLMDTWIDEGLSSAAEWVYSGAHTNGRLEYYNDNSPGLIKKGNNFFVWGNHSENNFAILDDYATVYLFFQWLRLQGGNTDIYRGILTSSNSDHTAVTTAAATYIAPSYSDWGTLLKTWLAANWINAPSGAYGYNGGLAVTAKYEGSTATSIRLAPGEGVYSKTNSQPFPSGQGSHIRNVYLGKVPVYVNDTTYQSGGALLTYNINETPSDSDSAKESGTTTGVATSVMPSMNMVPGSQPALSGLFPISAADMLRRNGHGEASNKSNITKLGKRFTINE